MEYRDLGRTGWKVSVAALGCWAPDQSVWSPEHDGLFKDGMALAREHGVNFFDTAECYGGGYSEKLLGEAVRAYRGEVYLASKVWFDHLRKEQTIKACEDTLRRMGTDYLDLYYIHYPDPQKAVPVEETMEAMLELKQRGLIRAIGVSNFTVSQMRRVCAMGRVEALQPAYSLLWRSVDAEVLPFCLEQDISLVSYSPTGTGILTGKYTPDYTLPQKDDRNGSMLFDREWFPEAVAVADKLKPLAEKYRKTPGQIAINWVAGQNGIASVLLGGKTPAQIAENLESFGWSLSGEDSAYLDGISREFTAKLPDWTTFFLGLGCAMAD